MNSKVWYNKDMIMVHGYYQLTWMFSFDYLSTVLRSGWRVTTISILHFYKYKVVQLPQSTYWTNTTTCNQLLSDEHLWSLLGTSQCIIIVWIKYRRSGVPTRGSSSWRTSKLCNPSQVEAESQNWKIEVEYRVEYRGEYQVNSRVFRPSLLSS